MSDEQQSDELSIVIRKDPAAIEVIANSMTALDIAKSWGTIEDADTAVAISEERNAAKKQITFLDGLYKKMVKPGQDIIELAMGWFKPAINAQTEAVEHYNALLIDWDKRETKRIEEENARRETENRRIRAEAEQKAAAERARAEQEAADRLREAKAQEAARAKAEAEGNAKAAQEAAAASAMAMEQSQAALQEGAQRANDAQMAAVTATTQRGPVATFVSGTTFRKNYVAKLAAATDSDAVRAIAAALPSRPELVGILLIDWSAASKMAKALEENFNIPGLKAENDKIPAKARGAK